MNPVIETHHGSDWHRVLSPGRRQKAQEVLEQRRRHNVDIDLIDCLMLEDRLTLLRRLTRVLETLGFHSKRAFDEWTTQLEELRNTLAHGGDILDVEPDPEAAIDMFAWVRGFAEGIWAISARHAPARRQGLERPTGSLRTS